MRVRIVEPEDLVVLDGVGVSIEAGGLLRMHEPTAGSAPSRTSKPP